MNIAYNMECMEGMKRFPDKYFDLAVVDPIYGDVTQGGYITGKSRGGVAAHPTYNMEMWKQPKTGSPDELICRLKGGNVNADKKLHHKD